MICFAKIVTNGVIPMSGVIVKRGIHDAFMTGPEHAVEFFHGYTYSGHPVAAAAAHATLDIIGAEGMFERARALEPVLEKAVHALKGEPGVLDIRNIGLAAAVDLEPLPGKPGLRALQVFERALDAGMLCALQRRHHSARAALHLHAERDRRSRGSAARSDPRYALDHFTGHSRSAELPMVLPLPALRLIESGMVTWMPRAGGTIVGSALGPET